MKDSDNHSVETLPRKIRRGHNEGSIYQRGDGRWTATITLNDKGARRQRRSFYGKTRAEVATKLLEAQKKHSDNLPIPGDRETLGSYLRGWLESSGGASLRPRTRSAYLQMIERHIIPGLGERTLLSRLSTMQLQTYMNEKVASGLSPRTVQYHRAVLRRALNQAVRWGKISQNVAQLVSPPKVERTEIGPLTPEQARAFFSAIAEDRDAALYSLALGLGLRQGEVLGLQWDDVDLEVGTVTVRHTLQRYDRAYHLDQPKTTRSRRTIALPPTLLQLLRAHRTQQVEERLKAGLSWTEDEWNLVFATATGDPRSGFGLNHKIQAILESAGLPRQRFHDLRHAAATFMLAQGVDLRVVMEVLGHSQITTTANTYAHVRLEATRVAAESVDVLLTG